MTGNLIKVGIIGCGAVTQQSYLKSLPRLPNVRISYVYDLNELNALKVANLIQAQICPPNEMKNLADAIVVATPPSSHYGIIKENMKEGLPIICEKPFVGKYNDAVELIEMAKSKKNKLFVAHFRRVFPHVQLVRSIAETGIMGEVVSIKVIEGGRFNWDTSSGYVTSDRFGGVLFDTGSHSIDMALFAANLDKETLNFKLRELQRDKAEPSHELKAIIDFDNEKRKGTVFVQLSRYRTLANLISIKFERGSIDFSVGLLNNVRLTGVHNSTILNPKLSYHDYSEPFTEQYRCIFDEQKSELFEADRFLNLTRVLEVISNG